MREGSVRKGGGNDANPEITSKIPKKEKEVLTVLQIQAQANFKVRVK